MSHFDALVLAAGRSSRLGVPKMLLPAGYGETVVSRVVGNALAGVTGRVVVVVGRDAELVRQALENRLTLWSSGIRERLHILENDRYESGLASSVVAGVQHLLETGDGSTGAVILLGDQPLVSAILVKRLIAAMQSTEGRAVAAVAACEGQRRNPVVFPSRILPKLLSLEGDEGARVLLRRHAAQVERVEFGPGLWDCDVDTWSDYETLATAAGWNHEPTETPKAIDPDGLPPLFWRELDALGHPPPLPWLAPGVLLVLLGRGMHLPPNALLVHNQLATLRCPTPAQGRSLACLNTVLLGDGASPQACLASLRAAALTTLGWSTTRTARQGMVGRLPHSELEM